MAETSIDKDWRTPIIIGVAFCIIGAATIYSLFGGENDGVILQDNTIVVDSIMDAGLVEFDDTQIIFKEGTKRLKEVNDSSVIVSGVFANAPVGYLRKVIAIERKDGVVVLKTEHASLTDAIKECDVRIRKMVFDKEFEGGEQVSIHINGSDTLYEPSVNEFKGRLKKAWVVPIIYNTDKTKSNEKATAEASISVNGSVSIVPELGLELKIKDGKIVKLIFDFDSESILALNLLASATVTGKHSILSNKELELPEISLPVFTVPIGPLMVPFRHSMVFTLDTRAQLKASLESNISDTLRMGVRYIYEDSVPWQPHLYNGFHFSEPVFRGSADAQAGVSVEYRLYPVSVSEATDVSYSGFGIRSGLHGTADFSTALSDTMSLSMDSLHWKLKLETTAFLKVGMKFFSRKILDKRYSSPSKDTLLMEGFLEASEQKRKEDAFNNYGSFEELVEAFKKDSVLVGRNAIMNKIFFDYNKASLKPESKPELDKIIRQIPNFQIVVPRFKVKITAHTDNIGSESFNLALSQERAESVFSYFVENGVDSNLVVFEGKGSSMPEFENDTKEHQAKNRRAKISFIAE